MTGVPLMSIMFPPLYEFLYNNFSLFGAMLVMGAIQLNVIVGGTFFRPINLASDNASGTQQKSLFKKLGNAFGRLIKWVQTCLTPTLSEWTHESKELLNRGSNRLVRSIAIWHRRRPGIPSPGCGIKEIFHNNGNLCVLSRKRVSYKIDLNAVWPSTIIPTVWELTDTCSNTIFGKKKNLKMELIFLLIIFNFRNPNFLLYSTSIAFVISGKFMVNPFIKDYAVKNIGLDKYQPAMILSICSGIDIIFRPLGGKLCSTKFVREKLGTFETFSIAVLGLGSCNLFAPLWVNSFATFAVYGVLFGLCFG